MLHGDSAERLKDVLDEVDDKCAFWLDAHAGAKGAYARGEVDCPLIQELELIKSHHIKDHVIAIDDAHLFGQKQMKDGEIVCDYSKITKEVVGNMIKSINKDYIIDYVQPYGQLMLVAYISSDNVSDTSTWWK